MAERYKSLYRCRLCGAKFHGTTGTTARADAMSYMVHQVAGIRGVYAAEPTHLHVHECDDGSLGLAEFLGMERTRRPALDMGEKTESGLLEE